MPVEVEVLNAGPHPINIAVLKVAADGGEIKIVYGTILPGERLKSTHLVNMSKVPLTMLISGVTLDFTDTYDNNWARSTYALQSRDYAARVC